jgi:hypothetical protein
MTEETKPPRRYNKSRGIKRGPYPENWCTGPDPRRHAQYYAYLKHKSQAAYRGELHELTWPEWETIWNTDSAWEQRGRAREDLCLTMLDPDCGWHIGNVAVVTRLEQLQLLGYAKTGLPRNQAVKIRKDRK